MEANFIVLSSTHNKAMVRCDCSHVEEVPFYGELEDVIIICELCGSQGGII